LIEQGRAVPELRKFWTVPEKLHPAHSLIIGSKDDVALVSLSFNNKEQGDGAFAPAQ